MNCLNDTDKILYVKLYLVYLDKIQFVTACDLETYKLKLILRIKMTKITLATLMSQ
jgi:hypothetical protein